MQLRNAHLCLAQLRLHFFAALLARLPNA